MKNTKTLWIITGIFIVVAFIIYNNYFQGTKALDPKVEALALCLKEKEVKMYGAYWCPHCQRQKEMFGPSWKHINYIECALAGGGGQGQTALCRKEGIQGYPTWDFGASKRLSGALSFEELSEQSGCPYSS